MYDKQVQALAEFLGGLNALTEQTGVEVSHYEDVALRLVEDPDREVKMHGSRDEVNGYELRTGG